MGPFNYTVPTGTFMGMSPVGGRVNGVAFDPNNPLVYYGASPWGGLWKTTDGGVTWNTISDSWPIQSASSVAVSPDNSNVIFAGTGDSLFDYGNEPFTGAFGLEKSIDGGATWTTYGQGQFDTLPIRQILVDPDQPNVIQVVTATGLWRSIDAGLTWASTLTFSANSASPPHVDVGIPDSSGVRSYYAIAGTSLKRSDDSGQTWTSCSTPGTPTNWTLTSCSRVDPSTVYVWWGGTAFVSTDRGATFTSGGTVPGDVSGNQLSLTVGAATINGSLADVLYLGLNHVWCSTDQGADWTNITAPGATQLIHYKITDVVSDPTDGLHLLVCSWGGIYSAQADPSGASATFSSLNATLCTQGSLVSALSTPSDDNFLLFGSLIDMAPSTRGDLTNWTALGPPIYSLSGRITAFSTAYDYANDIQYVSGGDGSVWEHLQGSQPPTQIFAQTSNGGEPFTMLSMGASPGELLVGSTSFNTFTVTNPSTGDGVWANNIGGQTWGAGVSWISPCPEDPNRIYVGTLNGQAWTTPDGGSTWNRIDGGATSIPPSTGVLEAIEASPLNPTDVLVAMDEGSFGTRVYHCGDISDPNRVWVDVSGTGQGALPNIYVYSLVHDPYQPTTTWYVASDVGVMMTSDGGNNWSNLSATYGMPQLETIDVRINSNSGYLYALTIGRGLWRLPVFSPAALSSVSSDNSVVGGKPAQGTVTLTNPAGQAGYQVSLQSSSPFASVPASVTVGSDGMTASFAITTTGVDTTTAVTITASANNITTTASINVLPATPDHIVLSPTSVYGGTTVNATLYLNGQVGPSGASATTTSDNAAAVPSTPVPLNAGVTSKTFTIATNAVASLTQANIGASLNSGSASVQLTVLGPYAATVSIAKTTPSGVNVTGSVVINSPAPASGLSVPLTSSDPSTASVPTSVNVPGGAKVSSPFTVTVSTVTTDTPVTITAQLNGHSPSAVLTVQADRPGTLTITHPSIVGGNTDSGYVTLKGLAPSGGTNVALSSSSPAATVQSSVLVPAGQQTSPTFNIYTSGVSSNTVVTISATVNSATSSASLTLTPANITAVKLSATSIVGGSSCTGSALLDGKAPSTGGTVTLQSGNTSIVAVPASVQIPANGSSSSSFTVSTSGVASTIIVNIGAIYRGVTKTASLTVNPAQLSSLSISWANPKAGTTDYGRVYLTGKAPPNGAVVTLTSSNPNLVTPPSSVTVPAGASTSSLFAIPTAVVTVRTSVTVTAKLGSVSKSFTITLQP